MVERDPRLDSFLRGEGKHPLQQRQRKEKEHAQHEVVRVQEGEARLARKRGIFGEFAIEYAACQRKACVYDRCIKILSHHRFALVSKKLCRSYSTVADFFVCRYRLSPITTTQT